MLILSCLCSVIHAHLLPLLGLSSLPQRTKDLAGTFEFCLSPSFLSFHCLHTDCSLILPCCLLLCLHVSVRGREGTSVGNAPCETRLLSFPCPAQSLLLRHRRGAHFGLMLRPLPTTTAEQSHVHMTKLRPHSLYGLIILPRLCTGGNQFQVSTNLPFLPALQLWLKGRQTLWYAHILNGIHMCTHSPNYLWGAGRDHLL